MEESDLNFQPKEFPVLTRLILYIGLAFAFYNCISIVVLSVSLKDVSDFFHPDGANRKLVLFSIADAIILFISWGAGIVVHKNDAGEIVELTKEKSKSFARFTYYMAVVMLLVVLTSLTFVIFGW